MTPFGTKSELIFKLFEDPNKDILAKKGGSKVINLKCAHDTSMEDSNEFFSDDEAEHKKIPNELIIA